MKNCDLHKYINSYCDADGTLFTLILYMMCDLVYPVLVIPFYAGFRKFNIK